MKFSRILSFTVCMLVLTGFFCSAGAADQLYRNIEGKWVPFDPVANPGYSDELAHDVVYYPGSDAPAFYVTYQDVISNTNSGFDDPTYGLERRTRVVDALNTIAATIVGETGSADIHFAFSEFDGTGALASCGPYYNTTPGTSGFFGGYLYDHVTTGIDPSAGYPDAQGTVDFGYSWYIGSTPSPGASQFDFQSVMLHEFTHALGFTSLMDSSGNSVFSGTNVYGLLDMFLENGNGLQFFDNPSDYTFNGTSADLLGNNNGVEYNGMNAVAEFGSNIPIYAPASWESGSSITHWDMFPSVPTGSVMQPAIGTGPTYVRRAYEDFEIGALVDFGYNLTPPITTPSTGPIGIAILLAIIGAVMIIKKD